jgi:protein-disulfide isomerase
MVFVRKTAACSGKAAQGTHRVTDAKKTRTTVPVIAHDVRAECEFRPMEHHDNPKLRWRHILDSSASAAVVVLCAVVVWKLVAQRSGVSADVRGRPVLANKSPEPPLPDAPVSLEGAKLRGSPEATVAIIGYTDFQCPYCAAFARDVLPSIDKTYIQPGRVLLAFRHLPLTSIHPAAETAARLAECAAEHDGFWTLHDRLFQNQPSLTEASAARMAEELGIKGIHSPDCMSRAADRVNADIESANTLHVSATPTFLLGTVDGSRRVKVTIRLPGVVPFHRFRREIDKLLRLAPGQ